MFEFTSLASVLPSYDVEMMVDDSKAINDMQTHANIALASAQRHQNLGCGGRSVSCRSQPLRARSSALLSRALFS